MTCPDGSGSGTTKGLHIGLNVATIDNGDRPIAKDAQGNFVFAYWASPNIRLVPAGEVDKWLDPSHWNGKDLVVQDVQIDTDYKLVVRVRNTDVTTRRSITLEAWVADLNAGSGPAHVIRMFPKSTTDFRTVTFKTDLISSADEVPPMDPANPDDPTKMAVLVGREIWRPNSDQLVYNKGHVCLIANIWTPGTSGGEGLVGTPAEGGPVGNGNVSPFCDRRHGQENLQIIPRALGATETRTVMVGVPATDRCPLEAEVAIKAIKLAQGDPQLAGLAAHLGHSGEHHCPPDDDPMETVTIDDNGDPSHELGICLKPGETTAVELTVAPYAGEKPGDIYAFDLTTTDESDHSVFGGARFYVMVTAPV